MERPKALSLRDTAGEIRKMPKAGKEVEEAVWTHCWSILRTLIINHNGVGGTINHDHKKTGGGRAA